MSQIYQNIGSVVLMILLLICSAFFSGSETALFNLSKKQLNLFKKSNHKLEKLVVKLLDNPGNLLSCILFGNMTVNILFYAVSSVFVVRIQPKVGVIMAAIVAVCSFCLLVLFGEILPKSIAYANSKSLGTIAALPLFLLSKVLNPFLMVVKFFVTEPSLRLMIGPVKHSKPITADEFKSLLKAEKQRGVITADENRYIARIVELGFLKVRDCLRPRVDMISCSVAESAKKARQIMEKNNLTKLPIYVRKIDNIIGMVHFRQLLLQEEMPLDKLIQKVSFVPEQKSIESLLDFFRTTRTDTAIVVDEYGGIAGQISLEDIAKEIVGPIEQEKKEEPIEQIKPLEYRLAGNLAIHNLGQLFGIDLVQMRISTMAGLMAILLGKVPKVGDSATLGNLKFTVEKVCKHRIETIILTFEPIKSNG